MSRSDLDTRRSCDRVGAQKQRVLSVRLLKTNIRATEKTMGGDTRMGLIKEAAMFACPSSCKPPRHLKGKTKRRCRTAAADTTFIGTQLCSLRGEACGQGKRTGRRQAQYRRLGGSQGAAAVRKGPFAANLTILVGRGSRKPVGYIFGLITLEKATRVRSPNTHGCWPASATAGQGCPASRSPHRGPCEFP